MYQITADSKVQRISDGAFIPEDASNADWRDYQKWLAEGNLVPPDQPSLDQLKHYAADKRWRVEVGGIMVSGIAVPTDDRSKTMIGRAARTNSTVTETPFVVAGVNYGVLTKAQFVALDAAIDEHVAATFETLASVIADIEAGTITTKAQIDAAFA